MDELLTMLRAAGDPSRLRILLLLRGAELTVSELTQILGQSQPRVSRHLKLLCDANLLQRFKEGSWVFYRSAERGDPAQFADMMAALSSEMARRLKRMVADSLPCVRPGKQRLRPSSGRTQRTGSASAPCMRRSRKLKLPFCG